MNRSHDYDRILTRLTLILQRLYEGETLGVTELAEEFNVSTKTIQRDFNERLARFPIEKEGRRWRMRAGHRIEKIRDIENLLTLQVLESLATGAGADFAARSRELLGRLKNETPPAVMSHLPIEDITSHAFLFSLLEEAIASYGVVRFRYHGKERTVHPYRIVNFDGYWYLLAKEEQSGLVKKFYLKEIEAAEALERRFEPDASLSRRVAGAINAWFDPNEEPFEIRLLAKAPIVKYLRRRPLAPTQRIAARRDDGDLELVVEATTRKEALELLKLWIPDLLVLDPPELRRDFENLLRTTLDRQTGHDAF